MDIQPKRITVNGVDLAYVEHGAGDPVVLVHGSVNDLRSWIGQLAPLAARYRVIAVSRRYHWPNDPPVDGDRYAIADHIADLGAFIDALGIAPARLVGSSYGAIVALGVAATRPGFARALVLGEPPLLPWLRAWPEGAELADAFLAGAWGPAGEASQRGDTEAMARLFIDGVIGPGAFERMPPPARAAVLDNAPEFAAELRSSFDDLFPRWTCDDLRRLDVPVLLLDGERSPRMFGAVQDALVECLAGAERATVPNTSHSMHLGNPEAYNETVLAFLARH